MAADLKGKVLTVLGPIDPSDLGRTLTHEHLMCDTLPIRADTPCPPFLPHMNDLPFTMDNLGFIRQYPWSYRENATMYGEEQHIIEELKFFRQHGGGSIVECTTLGLRRDVNMFKKMSEDSGVNIIAGTGYYVDSSLPPEVHSASQEELVSTMVHDVTQGADGTDVRCGVIGEIGTCWPITATEKRTLQAAAVAQSQLGCAVIIHPGRDKQAPAEVIRILAEAGGDISKTAMSHLDRTFSKNDDLSEFATLGCYLEFDLFGIETSLYQLAVDFDMPSDAQRIQMIKHVIQEGCEDRVVIAHDLANKHRLMHYGGHGYSHILLNVAPKMLSRGISQEKVDKILISNPRNLLTFE